MSLMGTSLKTVSPWPSMKRHTFGACKVLQTPRWISKQSTEQKTSSFMRLLKNIDVNAIRARVASLLDRCQACVFELWIPCGAASFGREVEDRPQRVEVWGSARILVGVGHLARHLTAPKVADSAIFAGENTEAGYIAIISADVGPGVVAFAVRVKLQVLPATLLLELEQTCDRRACSHGECDTLPQISGGAVP